MSYIPKVVLNTLDHADPNSLLKQSHQGRNQVHNLIKSTRVPVREYNTHKSSSIHCSMNSHLDR